MPAVYRSLSLSCCAQKLCRQKLLRCSRLSHCVCLRHPARLGGDTFDSIHPATEEKLHSFARGMKEDVDAAVEAAKVAWANGTGEWAQLTATERGVYVKKMCDGILANQEMLAQIEAADTGKTYADAFGGIGGAAAEGEHWADLGAVMDAEQDKPQPTSIDGTSADGFKVVMHRDPIGIVGLISAWNYPLNVSQPIQRRGRAACPINSPFD